MPDERTPGPKKPGEKRIVEQPRGSKRDSAVEQDATDAGKPSREEVVRRWRDPVTNNDEQEKITNSGGDGIPTPEK